MKRSNSIRTATSQSHQRRGAMMIFVAVMMVAFLSTVVLSIDLAYMHLARTELRSATDAAAKAAAQELSLTQNRALARRKAQEIASLNTVAGEGLLIDSSDVAFGHSKEATSGKFVFQESGTPVNSVKINGDRSQGSRNGSVGLFFGAFSGVEEFEPTQTATATFLERDVVLVVDRSGSMRRENKSVDLQDAIDIFIDTLNDTPVQEVVGLSSYSSFSTEEVQLTTTLSEISDKMQGMIFRGTTNISSGMDAGDLILSRGRDVDFVERTMIVMTDGIHNVGPEPRDSAIRIAAKGVTIHTITFGSRADTARMQEIAQIGSGQHHHAANGEELKKIYRDIALTLSTMITK